MLLCIAGKAVEEYKFGVMDNGVYAWMAKGGVGGRSPPHVDAFFFVGAPFLPLPQAPPFKKDLKTTAVFDGCAQLMI